MKSHLFTLFLVALLSTSCCSLEQYFLQSEPSTMELPGKIVCQIIPDTLEENQIIIRGKALDYNSGDPLIFCSVALFYHQGECSLQLVMGTETDFDGNYQFALTEEDIYGDSGELALKFSYLGMQTMRYTNFAVKKNSLVQVDAWLPEKDDLDVELWHWTHMPPLYEADNMTSGQTFTSEDIRNSGVRNR